MVALKMFLIPIIITSMNLLPSSNASSNSTTNPIYGKVLEVNLGNTEITKNEKICLSNIKVRNRSFILVEDIYECKMARKLKSYIGENIYLENFPLIIINPNNFSSSLFSHFPKATFFFIDHE